MKYTIDPAAGHYLLEEYKIEQKMAGGFSIPDEAQEKTEIGKVLKVSENEVIHQSGEYITSEFEDGDIVTYKPYTGKSIKLDGKTYTLVAFEDVTGKLNEVTE